MSDTSQISDMDELVTLTVNADTCISGGQCEMLEPETFLVDDDLAIATVIGSGQLSRKRALEVIDRCPASAISIVPSA